MNTNFFNQIAALNITGTLQILIAKGEANDLVVSVLPQNEHCGDNAKNLIMPFSLRGTAEELDNGFFEKAAAPIQTASGLMVNMEAFMKQLEETKKQSAMEKEKAEREKKAKEERDKKYKEAMQRVDELEKEGKFRDAWMKLPDPALFPEQAEIIRKRKTVLSGRFAPDLFGTAETVTTDGLQPEENWEDSNEE
ncbi:MAG: PRTRC system protein E [Niabella sp.]